MAQKSETEAKIHREVCSLYLSDESDGCPWKKNGAMQAISKLKVLILNCGCSEYPDHTKQHYYERHADARWNELNKIENFLR